MLALFRYREADPRLCRGERAPSIVYCTGASQMKPLNIYWATVAHSCEVVKVGGVYGSEGWIEKEKRKEVCVSPWGLLANSSVRLT